MREIKYAPEVGYRSFLVPQRTLGAVLPPNVCAMAIPTAHTRHVSECTKGAQMNDHRIDIV